MDRVELARERKGLTRESLAKLLSVSRRTLNNWSNGIPTIHLVKIAKALQVSEKWIASGENPPKWYLIMVMMSSSNEVRWETIQPDVIQELCSEWWYVLEEALLEHLMMGGGDLHLPSNLRVKRWTFIADRRGSFLSQFKAIELQGLATRLAVWPKHQEIRAAILSGIQSHALSPDGETSENSAQWQGFIERLELGVRGYRSARGDRRRQLLRQSEVWKMLNVQQSGEQLLAGRAIAPVLGACLRAARATEIVFSRSAMLENAICKALIDSFQGRSFLLHDLGVELYRYRGLRLIGRRHASLAERKRRTVYQNVISEDTVQRLLSKIAREQKLPLSKKPGRRSWFMSKASS